jgi:hypothetical protein
MSLAAVPYTVSIAASESDLSVLVDMSVARDEVYWRNRLCAVARWCHSHDVPCKVRNAPLHLPPQRVRNPWKFSLLVLAAVAILAWLGLPFLAGAFYGRGSHILGAVLAAPWFIFLGSAAIGGAVRHYRDA